MKNLLRNEILPVLAVVLVLGGVGWAQRAVAGGDGATKTSTFDVVGMTCGGCEAGVKLKVGKIDGVTSVNASYVEGTAVVTYDPEKVTPEQIVAAIEALGYEASLRKDEGVAT